MLKAEQLKASGTLPEGGGDTASPQGQSAPDVSSVRQNAPLTKMWGAGLGIPQYKHCKREVARLEQTVAPR